MQNIELKTPQAVPPKNFVDQVSSLVKNTLDSSEWAFSCEDIVLLTDEVASKDGLLPVLLWVAGQTLEEVWGEPQKLVFRIDSEALCGMVPELNAEIMPPSVWLHAIHYEIEQIVQLNPNGPAVIDEWFARWNQALAQKKIALLPPNVGPTPTQNQGGNA